MEVYGISWNFMSFYGMYSKKLEIFRNFAEFYEILRSSECVGWRSLVGNRSVKANDLWLQLNAIYFVI